MLERRGETCIQARQDRGESDVNERTIDDEVDRVEPVAKDGGAGGDRHQCVGQREDQKLGVVREQVVVPDVHGNVAYERKHHRGRRGRHPFQLLAQQLAGPPPPHGQRGKPSDGRCHGQEHPDVAEIESVGGCDDGVGDQTDDEPKHRRGGGQAPDAREEAPVREEEQA